MRKPFPKKRCISHTDKVKGFSNFSLIGHRGRTKVGINALRGHLRETSFSHPNFLVSRVNARLGGPVQFHDGDVTSGGIGFLLFKHQRDMQDSYFHAPAKDSSLRFTRGHDFRSFSGVLLINT